MGAWRGRVQALDAASLLCLAALAAGKTYTKFGDGLCNGGVGGSGKFKCLLGGACNEGGTPLAAPTSAGTGCPGSQEYLLCSNDASIKKASCQAACDADDSCVGYMVSYQQNIDGGRCELHTKAIKTASDPLQCWGRNESAYSLLGQGPCRTKELTVGGANNGTYYGNMNVQWVPNLAVCKAACDTTGASCLGVEYQVTPPSGSTQHKCEIHLEELGTAHMVTFQCWGVGSGSSATVVDHAGRCSLGAATLLLLLGLALAWLA